MNKTIQKIHNFILKNNLIEPGTTIILGLSGGPDSAFLLHTLISLKETQNLRIIAAHLDHEWREDSDKDAQFCAELCKKLKIEFVCKKASGIRLQKKANGSQEERGRLLRRHYFEEVAKEYTAHAIALAHHHDDQIETFFIRLIRGAGISGLTGMKARDGLFIRPLLSLHKKEILEYLATNNLDYCVDPTNKSADYLRNRIRHNVIPALQESDARFYKSFERSLTHLQETEQYLSRVTQEIFSRIFFQNEGTLKLETKKFFELDFFMQKKVLLFWLCNEKVPFVVTEKFLQEIIRFLANKSQQHAIHHAWLLEKKNNFCWIKHLN